MKERPLHQMEGFEHVSGNMWKCSAVTRQRAVAGAETIFPAVLVYDAVLLFSGAGAMLKGSPLSPSAYAGISCFVGALVQLLFVRRFPRVRQRTTALSLLVYVGLILSNTFAVRMTTAANATLLQFCSPIFAALFSVLFLAEPPRKDDYIATPIVLFGIAIFFLDRLEPGHLAGNLLGILSGVLVGGYTTLLRTEKDRSPLEMAMLGNFSVALFMLPAALLPPDGGTPGGTTTSTPAPLCTAK